MNLKTFLKKLGLSENAIKIYLALLSSKLLTIAEIAKTAKLYRPAVYRTLPELLEANLISETIKGKRRLYLAQSPSQLKNLLVPLQQNFNKFLPELEEVYKSVDLKPTIRFFENKEGIKRAFEFLLSDSKKNDIMYRYESPKDYKKNSKLYPKIYTQLATKHNDYGHSLIQKFDITNEATHAKRNSYLERYAKPIPTKLNTFDFNITQVILNDKVAFIDFESQTASVIQSQRFADFQIQIFKILFNRL